MRGAVGPVEERGRAVDGLEAVVLEETGQGRRPCLRGAREAVERLAKFPDRPGRTIITFWRTDIEVSVGIEGICLNKRLTDVHGVKTPCILSCKREKNANFRGRRSR